MKSKLCIMSCFNFHPEIEAAIEAEGWEDVVVVSYPVRCGNPPVSWPELVPLLPEGVSKVIISGRACLTDLSLTPPGWPEVVIDVQEYCFHWFAENDFLVEQINHGGYLMTPSWVSDWRGKLGDMGFQGQNAAEFFQDFARELILLDTGIDPGADENLQDMSRSMNIPCRRVFVGLDHITLKLHRWVELWRREEVSKKERECETRYSQKMAEYVVAMNLLGELATITEESRAVELILNLFRSLFAPKQLFYLPFQNGDFIIPADVPPGVMEDLNSIREGRQWVVGEKGFAVRLSRNSHVLGAMLVDELTFPEYKERYLNFALSASNVCALAIENSRTFQRMLDKEDELTKLNQELKEAKEKAEEATKLKDKFVSLASHDLRSPLNVIQGTLQNAIETVEGNGCTGITEDIELAFLAVSQMKTLIDDLLKMERFRSGQVGVIPELVDIHSLVEKEVETIREIASRKGVVVASAIPSGTIMYADERLLREVVHNLMSNAVKFCRRNDEVLCGLDPEDPSRLFVKDTGVGIDPDLIDSLFSYEIKTSTSGTDGETGTGFGLPLSQEIVRSMGGEITVESMQGKGSLFTVSLPPQFSEKNVGK